MRIKTILAMAAAAVMLLCASCGTEKEPVSGNVATPGEAVSVSAENGGIAEGVSKETAQRYLEILNGLKEQYGDGDTSANNDFVTGVGYVRLMDLDGDGGKELVCAYEDPTTGAPYIRKYVVYGKDSSEPLFEPREVSNFGNGEAPGMGYMTKNGVTYIRESFGGLRKAYFHLEENSLVGDLAYEETLDDDELIVLLNGETAEAEEATKAIADFERGGEITETAFFAGGGPETPGSVLSQSVEVIEALEKIVLG